MSGAQDLQLFEQLVDNANALFLSDEDFVVINGVTKPTLKKIYADFLASTGTYETTAAGIAATNGTGTLNRFFSVPGVDDTFDIRYRNEGGTAVEVGRLISNKVADTDTESANLQEFKDLGGQTHAYFDLSGQLRMTGMAGRSVQEDLESLRRLSEEGINKNIKIDSAPAILKLSDAQNAVMAVQDLITGEFRVPSEGQQSLQGQIAKLQAQVKVLYERRQIYDGWDFFAIDWRGKEPKATAYRIQNAINYLSKLPYGGTLFLRAGVYPLTNAIVPASNVVFIMERGARLLPIGRLSAFYKKTLATDINDYLRNAHFIDVEIDGSEQYIPEGNGYSAEMYKGMFIQGFKDCVFLRNYVHDTGASGLGIDFPDNSSILDCRVDRCGRLAQVSGAGASGIGIGTGVLQNEPLIVAGNRCTGNKNFGIFFERQSAAIINYDSRMAIVSNNICSGNAYGLGDCGVSGMTATGNQLVDNDFHGFVLDSGTLNGGPHAGDSGLFANNIVDRNGDCGIHMSTQTMPSAGRYVFSNNSIRKNARGVLIEAGTNLIDDISFIGGEVSYNTELAIHLASGNLSNFDINGVRMLKNGGATHVQVDANINVGSLTNCKLRNGSNASAISGAGSLTDFDISENQYIGTDSSPVDLSGTMTRVTYGRNVNLGA